MNDSLEIVTAHLLSRLEELARNLGTQTSTAISRESRFADVLDSMGLVELIAILAEDYRVLPSTIEQSVDRTFGTVAEVAAKLHAAGLCAKKRIKQVSGRPNRQISPEGTAATAWLAATAVNLPEGVQPASVLNAALERPPGWLEARAGIQQRRVWGTQDALEAAAEAGSECLERVGLKSGDIGVLLVTSEAPPLLIGLGAALHQRLQLPPSTIAMEVGGACTGFLTALWAASSFLARVGAVLIVAVEAPSRFLRVEPGPAGEAAALFGDAAAAALLCAEAAHPEAVPLTDVYLAADGSAAGLLQIQRTTAGAIELEMDGIPLAHRAVDVMAQSVLDITQRHQLAVADLAGVVAHGGNGRLPALLARRLGMAADRVWSETSMTGNLGSASLPVACAMRPGQFKGPVAWTAVGAGLTWGAALTGSPAQG